jgi:sugar lactone lactonase YvrE
MGPPQRVAVDGGGNLYFSTANSVFKVDVSGSLTLVAGNSRAGYSGDGGAATQAQLNQPQGVAVAKGGTLYIADTGNHVVRVVTTDGNINTFAGNGSAGYTGDAGLAIYAQLDRPVGVAVDSSGNVYVADSGSFVVRKVTTDGNIATVAGNGLPGFAGDGGSGVGSQLSEPEDIALDSSGNLYIADSDNNSVRKVDTSGNISTVAGNHTVGYSGDGAAATAAQLNRPVAVAVDSSGNLYIAEYTNDRIRKVDTKGVITTFAGNGTLGFAGDGSAASGAQFYNPTGLAADAGGNLYVADSWNYRVRKITSSGTVSTVAGNGILGYSGDGSTATGAQLSAPTGVVVDGNRNIYIADSNNHRVRKVTPNGVITTVAGTGTAGNGGDGGQATAAQLNYPYGVAVDGSGNLYIADSSNNRIRRVGTDGTISTVAGNGTPGFAGDGGAATSAQLNLPTGVAVDQSGNLYIADANNQRVRKVSGGTITTLAGNGVNGYASDGDAANTEPLYAPFGVAVDAGGIVYIADTGNNRIREVLPNGNIYTIAGTGQAAYLGDGGPPANAAIVSPTGVAVDAVGNIYIAGANASSIRKVSTTGTISTIAGGSQAGYAGDGGPAAGAQLNGAQAVAVDAAGDVYVADTGNNAVRVLTPGKP